MIIHTTHYKADKGSTEIWQLFGIKEYRDCLSWIDFMLTYLGPNVKIILTGISMGAATVMMAAGEKMPRNVVAALAESGILI